MKIQLNIGPRLGLGFGLLLVLLAGICAVAALQLRTVGDLYRQTTELEWSKSEAATTVNTLARANARRTMELLITQDERQLGRIDAAIAFNKKAIDEALALLRARVTRPEGKELLARIVERRQVYVASFTEVRRLVGAGQRDEAVKLMNTRTLPAIDALQEPVLELAALQKGIVEGRSKEVASTIDMALMAIGVLAAVALALGAAAAWWIGRSITRPVQAALAVAQRVASGDLTSQVAVQGRDELAQLLQALATMNGSLTRIVGDVRSGTETISTATSQIAMGNLDLSQRTEEQASSLQEIAASVEQLTSTVKHNLDSTRHANGVAAEAAEAATRGGAVVTQVVQTMEAINHSSRRIADIIGVIDSIAFQTNILALNAAVEAARAGEQGRGFAVVATEVRNLASRSASAAREIKKLIEDSVGSVDQGCKLVEQAGGAMGEIVVRVRRVADIMTELNTASSEQSSGIEQINQAMGQMDQMTQSNAALVEEAAAAAQSLERQSRSLLETVQVFQVGPRAIEAAA